MRGQTEQAIIIGGGIAGPVLALFLRRIGIDAVVYEGYPEARTIGGGFQIAPNGMNVLQELGLADTIGAKAAHPAEFCFRSSRGSVLARFGNGNPARQGQGAIATMRASLQQVILAELQAAGIRIEYNKRLRNISQTEAGEVIAHFEDGASAQGTFLVGADGINSRTRHIILPEAPKPSYLGVLGVGGLVEAASLPGLVPSDWTSMSFTLGRGGQFGYCPGDATGSTWMWWCHLPQDKELTRQELAAVSTEECRQVLLDRYCGWHEPIETLLRRSRAILRIPIYDLAPLPAWHKGRVVLMGDAAHAMSPAAGSGASIALEDAMYLAHVLQRTPGTMEGAFAAFEAERRGRAEKVVAMARKNEARQKQELGMLGCWVRDRMLSALLPLVGERSMRWLYDYRIAAPKAA